MVLRICALLSLLLAWVSAQAESGDGIMPGMTPMPQLQYNNSQAEMARGDHFYCLEFGQSRANFPFDEYSVNGQLTTAYNWGIFLQYPVLSYLDTLRKRYLFELILRLAQAGDDTDDPLENLSTDDFCIARVFHYRVSEYQESVLINIYFRGDIVQNPVGDNTNRVSIAMFDRFFRNGVNSQIESGGPYVRTFRGRQALAIESVVEDMLDLSRTEMNAHPFGTDEEGTRLEPSDDPTLRAVILGTSVGYVTPENITGVDSDSFATNPRPINFALEAGDYVFIVFGCIFLLILMFLTILGFCIHPFFLA